MEESTTQNEAVNETPQVSEETQSEQSSNEKKKSSNWLIILVVIIFVLLLVVGAYYFGSMNKDKGNELSVTPTPTQPIVTVTPAVQGTSEEITSTPSASITGTISPTPTTKPSITPLPTLKLKIPTGVFKLPTATPTPTVILKKIPTVVVPKINL